MSNRDAESLLVDALAAVRSRNAAPKFFDAKATIEDGQLVLRMPVVNVRGTRHDYDHNSGRTVFSLEFVNGLELSVDSVTYELICEALK